ncbi:hypothetical protein IY230_06190 [Acholeplasma laidlawii]|uniref:hypothetical protein n=1 Tax=Acholeplasma laidlawii TaxID=2148 RepID=UPI0018C2AF7D|nr:hypothetical protein [Acholeplasma laidlawii]MBG0763190.1 hypothetical protein [Acholeplasma laidlawii]
MSILLALVLISCANAEEIDSSFDDINDRIDLIEESLEEQKEEYEQQISEL